MLPSLLDTRTGPADLIGFGDEVRVYRKAQGGAGNGGWGASSETTVYEGPADVQSGARTLVRLAETGEAERANAVCYLPSGGADGVRNGDHVDTPLGRARVVSVRPSDGSLALEVLTSPPAPAAAAP